MNTLFKTKREAAKQRIHAKEASDYFVPVQWEYPSWEQITGYMVFLILVILLLLLIALITI